MERDERYDPQDIEKLMQEKAFSELLADEQEFVLKHLENEVEYEQVRHTMFAIKGHIEDDGALAPRPEMRRELISAFKKEQKKGYRYWLNSVGAFFFPQDGHAFWAPAMRFASVAALLGVAFFSYQQWDVLSSSRQLAELKEPVTDEAIDEKAAANGSADVVEDLETESVTLETQQEQSLSAGLAENNYRGDLSDAAPAVVDVMVESDFVTEDQEEFDLDGYVARVDLELVETEPLNYDAVEEVEEEMSVREIVVSEEDITIMDDANSMKDVATGWTAQPSQALNEVTLTAPASASGDVNDLAKSSSVRKEFKKKESRFAVPKNSRSLSQDAQLIGLLVQAW